MTAATRRAGVLGCGRMGRALGRELTRQGWAVTFGSRSPERARRVAADVGGSARGAGYDAAARADGLVVLATLWDDTPDVLRAAGELDGSVVLDATNPEPSEGPGLVVGHTTSGAEVIAGLVPGARIVKAFNHVYAELLEGAPDFGDPAPAAFLCADDSGARDLVAGFAREAGFEPVDAGPLSVARYTEPAAQLMVQLVRRMGMPPGEVALGLLRETALGSGRRRPAGPYDPSAASPQSPGPIRPRTRPDGSASRQSPSRIDPRRTSR